MHPVGWERLSGTQRICYDLALQSTDLRTKHGAVLTARNSYNMEVVVGTGYNSVPVGYSCVDCPRTRAQTNGPDHIASGTRLELCYAIHAEQAAVISALKRGMLTYRPPITVYDVGVRPHDNSIIFLDAPVFSCSFCSRIMYEAGVTHVVVLTTGGPFTLTTHEALKTSFAVAEGTIVL